MALSINTNMASLTAQRYMNQTQDKMSATINRLSTGIRILSSKDDAAGLAIAAGLETKVNSYKQGVRNGNDGISLLQTAETALNATLGSLQRMSQLASQAASGTYSASDRDNLNNEFVALLAELDNVANTTEFNGVALLNVANQADAVNPTVVTAATNILNDLYASLAQAATAAGDGNAGQDARDAVAAQLALYTDGGGNETAALTALVTNETSGVTGMTAELQAGITGALVALIEGIGGDVAGGAGADAAGVVTDLDTALETALTNLADDEWAEWANWAAWGGVAGEHLDPNSGDPQTISIYLGTSAPVSLSLVDARAATLLGAGAGAMNILTDTDANDALDSIADAITSVTKTLSRLGADNSKLEAAVNRNLSDITQLEASRSRIVDTDYAEESANLAKYQILQQAGASMLARANTQPQLILQLLQQ
ncbi:flagellin [Legionella nagasakiensis]|uniref:flagellin N-terminal helical domain-containing protein n=1 Tax=Legionella nagasakiensis TaxID=535290 RepID=UPI0010546B6C|nr:flagellin [Legionella nagasakiensis]